MRETSEEIDAPEPLSGDTEARADGLRSFLARRRRMEPGPREADEGRENVREEGYHDRPLDEFHALRRRYWQEPAECEPVEREPFGDVHDAVDGVNPHFRESRAWQVNCVDCSRAVELRWRGRDEVASGRTCQQGELPHTIEQWGGQELRNTNEQQLADRLLAEGHGASAVVVVEFGAPNRRSSGHAMNAVNKDGRIWLLDGQRGEAYPWPPSKNDPAFAPPKVEIRSMRYMGWTADGKVMNR